VVEYSDFILRIIEDLNYSDRAHTFMVHHEMGKGWSLYLAELYKNLFEEFEVRTTQFEMTDSTLVFEVVVSMEEEEEGSSYRNMESTIEDRYTVGRISDA
jgi:hypothetical protein